MVHGSWAKARANVPGWLSTLKLKTSVKFSQLGKEGKKIKDIISFQVVPDQVVRSLLWPWQSLYFIVIGKFVFSHYNILLLLKGANKRNPRWATTAWKSQQITQEGQAAGQSGKRKRAALSRVVPSEVQMQHYSRNAVLLWQQTIIRQIESVNRKRRQGLHVLLCARDPLKTVAKSLTTNSTIHPKAKVNCSYWKKNLTGTSSPSSSLHCCR